MIIYNNNKEYLILIMNILIRYFYLNNTENKENFIINYFYVYFKININLYIIQYS